MRRFVLLVAVATALLPSAASAGSVAIQASPNPAFVGARVAHTVSLQGYGSLDVWVSARGFDGPGYGTLPPGSWRLVCCPSETAGTAAWHYRSLVLVPPGTYRFGATASARGSYLSTARSGSSSASVWVMVA